MCPHRLTSTKTSWSRSSQNRSHCSSSVKSSMLMYHCMMRSLWENSIPYIKMTSSWCDICRILALMAVCPIALTSSTYLIRWNPNTWGIWLTMPTTNEWLLRTKICRRKRSRFHMSGGRNWLPYLSSVVRIIFVLTFSCTEHKGKTLHLLKQKAKEVPQQRKRRKLTVYGEGVEERK